MKRNRGMAAAVLGVLSAAAFLLPAEPALAWGDEGHEIIGLIADHDLDPAVRSKVNDILAGDTSHLTGRDIAHASAWADKYRDSDRDTTRKRYLHTRAWHYVDLELGGPDLASACYGRLGSLETSASLGPSRDCIVVKIDQFAAELATPATSRTERLRALQFLLHLVGDVHQPLHASDDRDRGGNEKQVSAPGMDPTTLHRYWDAESVAGLGASPPAIARRLLGAIGRAERMQWSRGAASDWALETFRVSERHAYGLLPPPSADGSYELTPAYVRNAVEVTGEQLSKAGVRLAFLLNAALK